MMILPAIALAVSACSGGGSSAPAQPSATSYHTPQPETSPISAFDATVYGSVTDATAGKPLAGAQVSVANGQRQATTDGRGRYRIAFPSHLSTAIQVSKAGYVCGLAMGLLRPHETYHKNWSCRRVDPNHPAAPPFPSSFGP